MAGCDRAKALACSGASGAVYAPVSPACFRDAFLVSPFCRLGLTNWSSPSLNGSPCSKRFKAWYSSVTLYVVSFLQGEGREGEGQGEEREGKGQGGGEGREGGCTLVMIEVQVTRERLTFVEVDFSMLHAFYTDQISVFTLETR